MVQVESVFAGCNRNLGIFDYHSTSGRIAYGSHNTVSLTNSLFNKDNSRDDDEFNSSTRVEMTLKLSGEVTAVKWINSADLLVAGCQDGSVCIWKYTQGICQLLQTLKPSGHSVSCVGVVKNGDGGCTDLAIANSAGGLYYYRQSDVDKGLYHEYVKYELPYGYYVMVISIIRVSEMEHVILCGGSKPVIQVLSLNMVGGDGDGEMKLEISLPGHDDWVRSIDALEVESDDEKRVFMFASGSLDRVIRLWKLSVEDIDAPIFIETNKLKLLTSKEYKFSTSCQRYTVFLDAILMGHDDWVSEVSFQRRRGGVEGSLKESELQLLSSSADSSIMIWRADSISGVWFPETRLGEMAIKGASTATGSSGGFYTSKWIERGGTSVILCNGKTGAFRCWRKEVKDEEWRNSPIMIGPARGITDLSWASPHGEYLLCTSLDQTTRLYSQSINENAKGWFEFGRPQIHGFDMITVKSISGTRFVSGGDEKVIRVFDMPLDVSAMLERECGIRNEGGVEGLPAKAGVPVLGLSNKAGMDDNGASGVTEGGEGVDDKIDVLDTFQGPPVEDILQRHTLWPEMEKLYGHGFEITTLDVSKDGEIISSACRSNISKHAVVRNFSTKTWLECGQPLEAHDLTITRLRYSHVSEDGREWLLSVSRDRKFALWEKIGEGFKLVKVQEKAHSRIIWDCCWMNYGTVVAFATCSRDREVKLWRKEGEDVLSVASVKFEVAVTAIDCIEESTGTGVFKTVIGLDDGRVYVYRVDVSRAEMEQVEALTGCGVAGGSISRISISPSGEHAGIGSMDGSVRIINFV